MTRKARDGGRRDYRLQVRMSEQERAEIASAAREAGKDAGTFMREAALAAARARRGTR